MLHIDINEKKCWKKKWMSGFIFFVECFQIIYHKLLKLDFILAQYDIKQTGDDWENVHPLAVMCFQIYT